ncbi:MAG: hypothetical protein JSV19_09010 [Phycisphaerales bacterium]|nr:MAG: hypothetical protein JSV19_09010 [Phycisphaerales bacterium]
MTLRGANRVVGVRWLVCLAAIGPGLPSPAADLPEALRDDAQGDHGRQTVDSLDLILSLGLNSAQARAILPLYAEACRLHQSHYRDKAEIQPQEIQAYAAFLAEDRLNRGFSPEVERSTARVHHRAKKARETFATNLNELAQGVWRILTPQQRRIAETYKPQKKAVFAAYASPKEKRNVARQAARRARRGPPAPRRDDPALAAARRELDTVRTAIHPRPDVIAKHLLTPAAAQWVYELAGVRAPRMLYEAVYCWRFGTRDYPLDRCRQDQKAIRALSKEINHWNLTNGMYFSPGQIEGLVQLAKQAEQLKAAQRQARPREKLHPDEFNARLVQLELAAESVLRPGQLEVMREYKPCLIPPKNLKNPVRVGQANDGSHLARWLQRARRTNNEHVDRMIDSLISSEIKRLGPMSESAIAERRKLLRDTARQAAGMSDVEFALNQDDLAGAITPINRKEELTAAIDQMHRIRTKPGRTHQFLLNRDFANVLMVRYQQLKSGAAE